jgi:hypothetical protein
LRSANDDLVGGLAAGAKDFWIAARDGIQTNAATVKAVRTLCLSGRCQLTCKMRVYPNC